MAIWRQKCVRENIKDGEAQRSKLKDEIEYWKVTGKAMKDYRFQENKIRAAKSNANKQSK